MSKVDVTAFCNDLVRRDSALAVVLDDSVRTLLGKLNDVLQPCGLHFGYRTIEEIARYLKSARDLNVLNDQALDVQIEQKILTKVRGGPEVSGLLDNLLELLSSTTDSRETVLRLQRDLDRYGSCQYWT